MILRIGRVVKTKGLKGEMEVDIDYLHLVEVENFLFFERENVVVGKYKIVKLKEKKIALSRYIIKLENVDNIEKAKSLCGCYIGKEMENLPENVFLLDDLKKCSVKLVDGEVIGRVVEVIKVSPKYSVLELRKVVSGKEKEFFVPFVKEIIKKVNIIDKEIVVKNIDGLFEQ